MFSKYGLQEGGPANAIGVQLMYVPSVQSTLSLLIKEPAVEYAEPNYLVELDQPIEGDPLLSSNPVIEEPNDPYLSSQYALPLVNAFKGWEKSIGNKEMVIAVVDTGIDYTHPDLVGKVIKGYDFVENDTDPMDENAHGTHVAGIASALSNNGEGIAGIAPEVTLMAVRVLNAWGGGTLKGIADGILWATDNGAKGMNMSLGIYESSKVMEEALQYALDKDVVITASSGNSGTNADVHLPSTYPGVIEVNATDKKDKKASFSNYGETASVCTPGVDILSTILKSRYGNKSGTSMSAPHVLGLVGLVRSVYPTMSGAQVKAHIEATADDLGTEGFDLYYGYGRINLLKALSL